MNSYKLFVKRIGLLGITNFLVALNTLLLIPILSKNLSVSDYGIYVQALTTFFLITSIAGLGLPYAIIRFLSNVNDKRKIQEDFFSMGILIIIFSFFISLIILIFANEISTTLFNGDVDIVKIIALTVLVGPINCFLMNLFVAIGQMKKYSLLLLFQTYLSILLVSYFALSGKGIFFVLLGFLISQLILFLAMIILVFFEIGFTIPKFKNIKEFLDFSIPIIPNNLATWMVESSDKYVIGVFLGTTFVAYYAPGYTLGMAILLLFTPISVLLSSTLPKYYENYDMEVVMLFINYSLKYFLLFAIPTFFILSILSKQILMIMTTQEIALNGYFITPFVALSSLLYGAFGIIMNLIILEKKTKIIGSIWIIAATISLFNILLVPIFGIVAAAIVTLISYLTAFIIGLNYSKKFFKYNFDYSFILKSISTSIVVSLLIAIVNPKGFISVSVVFIFSFAIYLFVLLKTNCIDPKELDFFKSIIKDK